MRLRPLPLLCLCLPPLAAAPAFAQPQAWRADPVHTQVMFSIDHQGFNRSLGLFKISDGRLQFDADDWSSAQLDVSVDVASLLLGDAKWEEAVKSWRFLDAKRWPQARYRSRSVERGEDGRGTIRGELELHGRTHPLDLQFRLNKLASDPYTFKRTAGFSATATLRRSDYGIDKVMSAVGDAVELRIEAAFVRDRDAADPPATTPATKDDSDGLEE